MVRSRLITSILVMAAFLAVLPLHAGKQWTRFEHLSLAEGLPEAGVTTILQDRLGFLWFGTLNGLVRHDGVSFVTYRPIPGDETSAGAVKLSA